MWRSDTRYGYQVYGRPSPSPLKPFSRTEIEHILIAFAVLTLDFEIILGGISGTDIFLYHQTGSPAKILLLALPIAVMVTVTGFVSHEMAHKFAARRLGFLAEFRMYLQWLLLSVVFSFLGFLFAAPGATMVRGGGGKRESGLTSIVGPGINLVWAGIFFALSLIPIHYYGQPYWSLAFQTVATVNLFWAMFNLIPWGQLDGRKVLSWNVWVWGVSFFGSVALFLSFLFLQV